MKKTTTFYFSCWHIIIPKISFYSIHKYNCYGYETKKTIFIVSSKYSIHKIFHTSESQTEKKKTPTPFSMGSVSLSSLARGRISSAEIPLMSVNRFDMFSLQNKINDMYIQSTQAQQDLKSSWWNLDRTTEPRGPFCGHKNLYTNNQFIANLWLVWKKKLLQEIHNLS